MAIKTEEAPLIRRFYPGGSIEGIVGYYAPMPKASEGTRTPKTEFTEINPLSKTNSIADLNNQLLELLNKGASRVSLQVKDNTGKKDFIEFHIERLLPPEMLPVSPAKDCIDFMQMVKEMRTAQEVFKKIVSFESTYKVYQLEQAVDLKIAEMQTSEPNKNQTTLF